MALNHKKPVIEYPCQWEYKLIGESQERISEAVFEACHDSYSLTLSNQSAQGKYKSMRLLIVVRDEEQRNELFIKLKQHPAIKIVI